MMPGLPSNLKKDNPKLPSSRSKVRKEEDQSERCTELIRPKKLSRLIMLLTMKR